MGTVSLASDTDWDTWFEATMNVREAAAGEEESHYPREFMGKIRHLYQAEIKAQGVASQRLLEFSELRLLGKFDAADRRVRRQ